MEHGEIIDHGGGVWSQPVQDKRGRDHEVVVKGEGLLPEPFEDTANAFIVQVDGQPVEGRYDTLDQAFGAGRHAVSQL